MRAEIDRLVEVSVRVYHDCLLPNGCLVAAPSQMPYYPRDAKSYLYCWPGRDLGFAVAGMETLGYNVREPLLGWILDKAEGFRETGLIYEEYHPNGPRKGPEWQPDQAGTLLWALCRSPQPGEVERRVVQLAADGLVRHWTGRSFDRRHRDLWERRFASPRHGSNLTYTLAACARGLLLAAETYARDEWGDVGTQMADRIRASVDPDSGRYLRRFGMPAIDSNPDASLIGLAWPFDIVDDDDRLDRTIAAVERDLLRDNGLYRYIFDGYDGEVEEAGAELRQGAGAWPLLTFWFAIVLYRRGRRDDAERVFRIGLASADVHGHLAEQRFLAGDDRTGVSPLLWSHMMFVLAAAEIGLLPQVG